jgi:hypothetical protein
MSAAILANVRSYAALQLKTRWNGERTKKGSVDVKLTPDCNVIRLTDRMYNPFDHLDIIFLISQSVDRGRRTVGPVRRALSPRFFTKQMQRHSPSQVTPTAKWTVMLTGNIKPLRTDFVRTGRRKSTRKGPSRQLLEYAKLDWEPWTRDGPADSLIPSDESISAVAEASRTAYSIMQLTKNQLIKIHGEARFDGFAEITANLADTTKMLRAMIEMIEGARGRMIVSACACLQNNRKQSYPRKLNHCSNTSAARKPADRA